MSIAIQTGMLLYDLRHTFLARLGESGCDVWTLARIAGHSNTRQPMRYVHPSDDTVIGEIERMCGHISGHSGQAQLQDQNQRLIEAMKAMKKVWWT